MMGYFAILHFLFQLAVFVSALIWGDHWLAGIMIAGMVAAWILPSGIDGTAEALFFVAAAVYAAISGQWWFVVLAVTVSASRWVFALIYSMLEMRRS
jgi:hypothetical protein